jgi:hypothetical protein
MAILTQELLKKKLSSWTLSSKVPEHLGFDESKGLEIKQELQALVEMGLVERIGERRGLKFRFKSADNKDEQDEVLAEEKEEEEDPPLSDAASLRAYFADRDTIKSETSGKTPLQMMSVITGVAIKDPSVTSHTLAYKRTAEGDIIVTFWQGCVKQYEKSYTLSAFNKVLTSELKALSKPISV